MPGKEQDYDLTSDAGINKKEGMNKVKLYWVCQFGGWFVFVLLEAVGHGNIFGYSRQLFYNALLNYFVGVGLTHLYRLFLIRTGWLALPLYRLIPRAIGCILVMTVIMSGLNIPLDRYTFPLVQTIPLNFGIIFGYLFFWGKYILLWSLIYHMFQYWERSLNAEKIKAQIEVTIKENQYNNLKAQLNPHFLFNSLNSIRTLVDVSPETAKTAITQLSGLLRSSLQLGKHKTVTLKDELETVKNYLAIEKIRFDDRLKIIFNIDENTLPVQVPPLMLQTLVENSVKHGISNSRNGGEVRVKSFLSNHHLTIEIQNTGSYEPKAGQAGLGIENTIERLKLLFDDKATFSIRNFDPSHVLTTIEIPV